MGPNMPNQNESAAMKMAIQICHEFAVMWAQQAMGGDRSGASDHKESAAREIIEELRNVNAAHISPSGEDAANGTMGERALTDEQRVAIQECIDYLKPAAAAFSDLRMGDSKHARCIRTLRALLARTKDSE